MSSETLHLTIKDVCDLQAGYGFESHKYKESGEPILRVTSLKNNQIDESQLKYFSPLDYSKDLQKHQLHPNEIVISKDGTVGKVAFNNKDRSFYLSSQLIKVIPKEGIHTKYLFHFLISKNKEIEQMTTGKSAILHLNLTKFKELKIPVPPLEKQKEIANLLDKFWKLSEELEEELSLRKQQYKHYRDELLSFKQDNKIKWLDIGKVIFQIQNGFSFKSNKFKTYGKPIIRGQNIKEGKITEDNLVYFDENDYPPDLKNYIDSGDIVITRWGTIGKIGFHFGQERLFFNQNICKLVFNNKIVKGKYLYYLLLSKQYKIDQLIAGAALPIFDIEKFKKIAIPIPSLEKQKEIVDLLDKFWELSNNIKEGLPAEILFRKQQYAYYRDALMNQY